MIKSASLAQSNSKKQNVALAKRRSSSSLKLCDECKMSDCSSNNSNKSHLSAMLKDHQRLIFRYPDGTYCYAYKCSKASKDSKDNVSSKKDTWLQVKSRRPQDPNNMPRFDEQDYALSEFQVIQIEDELEFLVNNLEYLVEPEDAISNYFHSRNVLYLLMLANICLQFLITYYVIRHEAMILEEL